MRNDVNVIINSTGQDIVLTSQEFEYVQWMLDFGATLEQLMQEIRPESSRQHIVDCVLG